ncbi:MAG: prohibitin family protein [Candidatus Bathyarchaeia archaeon]
MGEEIRVRRYQPSLGERLASSGKFWLLVGLLIVIVGALLFSVASIAVGEVAVITDPILKSVWTVGDGTKAQYYLKPPWAAAHRVYVAVDYIHMYPNAPPPDFPSAPSLTKDGLAVGIDLTIRWSVSPSQVKPLFLNYPKADWKTRTIIPTIRQVIRDTIVKYNAIETIEYREEISQEFFNKLNAKLQAEESVAGAILLQELNLRDISLPARFTEAIEAKLSAEQQAKQAEFQRQQILTLADARAKERIIVANGTAQSLRLLAEYTGADPAEITALFLQLEAYKEMTEKGARIIVITGQGQYIIPLPQE